MANGARWGGEKSWLSMRFCVESSRPTTSTGRGWVRKKSSGGTTGTMFASTMWGQASSRSTYITAPWCNTTFNDIRCHQTASISCLFLAFSASTDIPSWPNTKYTTLPLSKFPSCIVIFFKLLTHNTQTTHDRVGKVSHESLQAIHTCSISILNLVCRFIVSVKLLSFAIK